MLGVEISIAATTVLVVLTRFYTRTIIKSLIGVDDWIMGVALARSSRNLESIDLIFYSVLQLLSHFYNVTELTLAPESTCGM